MHSRSQSQTDTRRYLVAGRVQGVGFRAATRRQAIALGLAGFARNLEDGRVDVQVSGAPAEVARFRRWLERGPAPARVDEVEETSIADVHESGFRIS